MRKIILLLAGLIVSLAIAGCGETTTTELNEFLSEEDTVQLVEEDTINTSVDGEVDTIDFEEAIAE